MAFPKFPMYRQPWGTCQTCGFDFPVSKIRRHNRWGFQCTGVGTNECFDGLIDRDMQMLQRRLHPGEGSRKTQAPLRTPLTEGVDGDVTNGDS